MDYVYPAGHISCLELLFFPYHRNDPSYRILIDIKQKYRDRDHKKTVCDEEMDERMVGEHHETKDRQYRYHCHRYEYGMSDLIMEQIYECKSHRKYYDGRNPPALRLHKAGISGIKTCEIMPDRPA